MSPTTFVDAFADGPRQRPPMDEAAFLELYARTAAPLTGYLRRLTGNSAVADDLLQDTYIRLLHQVRLPDNDDHRRHYVFRVATNLARDYFRRASRQVSIDQADEPQSSPDVNGRASDIWAQLARVSTRDRELLLLAYVEGMTHAEIAAVTGLMRASIRPLLFRARRRFAVRLRSAGLDGAWR
jgi:RNA polymerase sigma-70 factor (ECF subfamily)